MSLEIISVSDSSLSGITTTIHNKIMELINEFGMECTSVTGPGIQINSGYDTGYTYYNPNKKFMWRLGYYNVTGSTYALILPYTNGSESISGSAYKTFSQIGDVYYFEFGVVRTKDILVIDFNMGNGVITGVNMRLTFVKCKITSYIQRETSRSGTTAYGVITEMSQLPATSILPTPSSNTELIVCFCVDSYGGIIEGALSYKSATTLTVGGVIQVNSKQYLVYSASLLLEI